MSSKRNVLLGWIAPGIVAVGVAAGLLVWQWPAITPVSKPDTTNQASTAADEPIEPLAPGSSGGNALAQSADHVRVTALRSGNTVTARIVIDRDWHINANPASLDFLIPTTLTLRNVDTPLSATVDYPQGQTIDVGLAQPIRVYSDAVRITATVPTADPAAPVEAVLRIQACSNSGRCLMPSTVAVQALASGD